MRQRLFFIIFAGLLLTSQTVVFAQGTVLNGFSVSYSGRAFNIATNRTTFTYTVAGTNVPPDLSHFGLEIPTCQTPLETVAYSPAQAVSFGVDPTTGVNGIKWDLPLGMNQTRVYSVTFAGNVAEGAVQVAVKGGSGFQAASVPGPSCVQAGIKVVKSVSTDGGTTWNDSEIPTGPVVPVGTPVSFLFQITNTGDFPLENVTLTDSVFDLSSCGAAGSLAPDAVFECIVGPFPATEGQHVNIATATGNYNGTVYTDTDAAHYFAGTLPKLTVEKLVGLAGGSTWYAADSAPGLIVPDDDAVSFRFVIANEGTETFTNITLADSKYSTTGCQIPAELRPTQSFECVIGPFDLDDDDDNPQVNILTVNATANGQPFTVTDEAHYQSDDDDDTDVIIVIEGPVEVVINNIIIIYGIEIQLNQNDPLITVIKVGDVIRVEGSVSDDDDDDDGGSDTTIIVVAVVVVVIDVDIYVVDNQVWRDDGDCGNAPPPWAPAHGWRRKCGGNVVIIIDGGRGKGKNKNKGKGGDNDDDDD